MRAVSVDLRRTPETFDIKKAVIIYLDKSSLQEKEVVVAHSSREDIVCRDGKILSTEA